MIQRIRELAKQRGISLNFICKKIDVASPYFLDLEKSRRLVPDDKLKQIADVLFTSVEYLKGETSNSAQTLPPDTVTDEELKFALFGGEDGISDAQLEEVKKYAAFIKQRDKE